MKYRIWQKITKTGDIEIEDNATILSVEDVKDDKTGEKYQMVTYVIPVK